MMLLLRVVVLHLVIGSGVAWAESADEMTTKGDAAFSVGRFVEAADAFEAAFAMSQEPRLLWKISESCRRQYEIDHKVKHLRRARLVIENYSRVARTPAEQQEAIDAMVAISGQIAEDEAAHAPAATVDRGRGLRLAGIGLLVAGVAGLGAGIGMGVAANGKAAAIRDEASQNVPFDPSLDEARRTFGSAAMGCYVAGGVLAAVGAVVLGVGVARRAEAAAAPSPGPGAAPAPAPVSITPVFGPGAAGLSAAGRF